MAWHVRRSSRQLPLDLVTYLSNGCAQVVEHARRDALAFDHEAEQQVLGPNVLVTHPLRLFEGELDHLLDPRSRDDLLDHAPLIGADDGLDRLPDDVDPDAEHLEDAVTEAFLVAQYA